MNLANLPIARKLYGAFGAIIVLMAVLGVLFYSLFASVTAANDRAGHTYQAINEARSLAESLSGMEAGVRGYAMTGDDTMLAQYRQGADAFRQHLAQAKSLTSDNPQQQDRLQRLEAQESAWSANVADNQISQRRSLPEGSPLDALVSSFMAPTGKTQTDAMRATIAEISSAESSELSSNAGKVAALQTQMQGVLIVGTLAAVALSVFLATWISRLIARPLGEAVALAKAVATGDLTRSIAPRTTDEVGALLGALQSMQAKLVAVVTGLKTVTESINAAAHEVASGNTDLSSRTEQQAASLEETASSMEQLTATVKQNADNARQASTLSENASEISNKGKEVVGRVVTTMNDINQNSAKIADITGIIEGIAFQTNILALNAAVEAARAGEQGRGFAVVASEVRSLAQRSSSAAKEIKDLLGASVKTAQDGSLLANEAGLTMSEVTQAVSRVTNLVGEIAAASDEQSRGIEQVNQAIGQMDQVTQQNTALVEEAAAAATSLEDRGRQLRKIVSNFQLPAAKSRAVSTAPRANPDSALTNPPPG